MPRLLPVLAAVIGCCSAASAQADESSDPWQGLNLRVFAFNEFADRNLLKPVARAWRWVLPSAVQRGVHNLLENLDDPGVALNQLLQGKPGLALSDAGRFVVNSTVGLAGLIDVASPLGLAQHEEDFGQTLAVWGVPSGPFLTLPVFGPSTPTNAVGLALDTLTQPTTWLSPRALGYGATTLDVVDTRVQLLDAEELITGDRYTFLRDAYLQRRAYLEADGNVADPFLDEETFEEPNEEPAAEAATGDGEEVSADPTNEPEPSADTPAADAADAVEAG